MVALATYGMTTKKDIKFRVKFWFIRKMRCFIMKFKLLKNKEYKCTIAKQEETIKNLAKSVAEGWCENARLKAQILALETSHGE